MAHRHRKPSAEDLLLTLSNGANVWRRMSRAPPPRPRLQDAVCRCVEVVGEAAGRLKTLDPGPQHRHPDLDLARAYGARNLLAHGYPVVDHEVLWNTATKSVSKMAAAARALLQSGS